MEIPNGQQYPQVPPKTSDTVNHHIDSRNWNKVTLRDGDIFIGTYAKSGTTWMEQMVRNMLRDIPQQLPIDVVCPWVDFRLQPDETFQKIQQFNHRRFFKHHSPLHSIPKSPKACYIFIARDGRDVIWSFYTHHKNHTPAFYSLINTGDFDGPPFPVFEEDEKDVNKYVKRWIEKDGYPFWNFWESISSWWQVRDHPQVLLCHYENLLSNPREQIEKIYSFIKQFGEVVDDEIEDVIQNVIDHSNFEYMKKNAETIMPGATMLWSDGANTLINKGTNRRWQGVLQEDISKLYEQTAIEKLGKDCAQWLATGEDPTRKYDDEILVVG